MAVRIRLKRLGRRHRPFYRVCAMDSRAPRDGKVIEELGVYDPMIRETDARVTLNQERVSYWLGVGAQPTEKVQVLINKYGPEGTHLQQQSEAMERLKLSKPTAPPAEPLPTFEEETPAEEAASDEAAAADEGASEESVVAEDTTVDDAAAEEAAEEEAAEEEATEEEAAEEEAAAEEAAEEEATEEEATEEAAAEEATEGDSEEESE